MDTDPLEAALQALGIAATTTEHIPLRTMADSRELRERPEGSSLAGGHAKNLFLKDKQGRFWLLAVPEQCTVDLRAAAAQLGTSRLSFASVAELEALLGIVPGAVSPLAAINDRDGQVNVVLELGLLDEPWLNLHPLRNDRTMSITPAGLVKFLEAAGHPPSFIHLGG